MSKLETEKYCISSVLKYPDILAEYNFISEDYFDIDINKSIFKCIKNRYNSNQPLSAFIVAQYLERISIQKYGDMPVTDYLDSLEAIPITKKQGSDWFEELKKLNLRKMVLKIGENIKKIAKTSGEMTEEDIITTVDKEYCSSLLMNNHKLTVEDMFDGMEAMIDERGKNPMTEIGYVTPFPTFNQMFGGFRKKNVYAFLSRPSHGKSTLLNYLLKETCLLNQCEGLYLDTEMSTEETRWRNAAAITGVPMWHLESGQYRKNKKYNAMYEQNKHKLKQYNDMISHVHVPGVPTEQVISIIKRWYYGKVKNKEKRCIIVYDYIKLTGEDSSNGKKQEYQLIGEKVDALKVLCAQLDIPLLTACQLNRTGEETDDSSAIAQSDRLQWFASFVSIFRRKRPEELQDEVGNFGSHKMIPLKTRFQGASANGHNPLVTIMDKKSGKNKLVVDYLNFDVDNFSVVDKGSLKDIMKTNDSGILPIDVAEDRSVEF